ncbi:MAG TPA: two-component regulator propeller domain-containing protein [Kofleriaceae bacterium]|nr:two-component regulator propeller domain-containing protein [Kofleriaceae bacterium]
MKRLVLSWIAWTALSSVPASAERWPIRTYTTADGLVNDRVDRGTRDALGYLWFSTIDGVSRFDGRRFESFGVRDGLPSSATHDILATRDGVLWVATAGGVAWLDPRTRGTRLVFHAVPTEGEAIALSEDADGRLWVATEHGLVEVVDRAAVVRPLPAEAPRPSIVAIASDAVDRSLWLGTWHGVVHRRADGSIAAYPFAGDGVYDDRVFALQVDRARRLWLSHVDQKVLAIPLGERFPVAPGVALWPSDGPGWLHHVPRGWGRRAILEDSRGTIWIGTTNELVRYDDRGFRTLTAAEGIAEQSPTPLVEDAVGNLWIGTDARGVQRIASRGLVSYDRNDGLDGVTVMGLAEARGQLYVLTDCVAHQLHGFDGRRFTAVRPRLPDDVVALAWIHGQTIAVDRDDRWWYPTGQGVAHYPRVARLDELAATPPDFFGVRDGLPGRDIARVYEDHRGDVWIATMSRVGLARWDRAADRIAPLAGRWPTAVATAFAEDASGALWIGFEDGQLVRVRDGVPEAFGTDAGVPPGAVTALLSDRRGRLWLGSDGSGVARIVDPRAARPAFAHYTTEHGLASERVATLIDDLQGRIYIGTSHGIDRLDPATGDIGHFDTADGLPNNYVTTSLRTSDGALWFGTKAGPGRLLDDTRPIAPSLPTYITGLRVTGAPRAIAIGGDRNIAELELASDENQLDIAFTSPAFAVGESLRFQYRLDDDAPWSAPVSEREVHFPRLAPGRYRFSVRAVLGARAISPAAHVAFAILPPLWQRGWFLALAAIALGGVAYRLYRVRVAHLLAIERVRTRIATDLHDDLGSSLSRIAILSEVATRRAAASEGVAAQIGDIGRSARELVDVASDIVWSTDPRRDDLKSLLVRLRGFASDVLEGRGIAWSMEAPADPERIKLGPERRRQLFLILKEAIHNAARHAGARRVDIAIARADGALAATVCDDGCGFDAGTPGEGNGLASMRARAEKAGGALRVESGATGTRVIVRLPLVA